MMQNHIRLDDLLARDVAVQWFEGVSLVQSVARRLDAAGTSSQKFPTAADILLGPDGAVATLGTSGGDAVAGAAHLVAQMLSEDAPVRLRLIVTQATGAGSAYTTLAELSEALTYFERPDPQLILQGLYERAMLASARVHTSSEADQAGHIHEQPAKTGQPASPGHVSRGAIVAVCVAAVICGSVWLIGFGSGDARLNAAVETIRQTLTGSPAPAADEPVEREKTAPARTRARRSAGSAGNLPKGADRAVGASRMDSTSRVPALSALSWPGLSFVLPRAETFVSEGEPIVMTANTGRAALAGEIERGTLYSRTDPGVTLPRHVYPKFPVNPPSAVTPGDTTILEIVVGTDGLVERVKLRTPPRNIHEFMLLSAAKAWRFEPATRDGRSVRFLHTLAITQ